MEKIKHLSKYWGVVNTGRPLQVKYWGVATRATHAALTPMPAVSSMIRESARRAGPFATADSYDFRRWLGRRAEAEGSPVPLSAACRGHSVISRRSPVRRRSRRHRAGARSQAWTTGDRGLREKSGAGVD